MSRVTDEHVVPPTDPNNPWNQAQGGVAMANDGGRRFIDDAATGLDGPLLDELLKIRMTEGIGIGRARGMQTTQARFPEIHDNGYRNGRRDGWEVGYGKAAAERDVVLRGLLINLRALVRLSRGKVMKEKLGEQIKEIEYSLGLDLRPGKAA